MTPLWPESRALRYGKNAIGRQALYEEWVVALPQPTTPAEFVRLHQTRAEVLRFVAEMQGRFKR